MLQITQARPVRVFATGGQSVNHLDERYDGKTPDILDNAYVVVDFDDDSRGMLDLCMFAEASVNEQEIVVTGDVGKDGSDGHRIEAEDRKACRRAARG